MYNPLFKVESVSGTPTDISHLIRAPEVETVEIPRTMEASINMEITPEFIKALINVGLLESIPAKQPDGSISNELLIVDPEWPSVIG